MAKAKRSTRKAASKQVTSGSKQPKKKHAARIKASDQQPVEATQAGRGTRRKSIRKATSGKPSVRKKTPQHDDLTSGEALADKGSAESESKPKRKAVPHCNDLDGKRWIQNSISVWSDIRKTAEENRLKHPAMFPGMLVERLVETFLRPDGERILDPFSGSGSTIVEVERLGKTGIGIELSPEYAAMARNRVADVASSLFSKSSKPRSIIHEASVADITKLIQPESIDLCITSPPYWDILNQRRTADYDC